MLYFDVQIKVFVLKQCLIDVFFNITTGCHFNNDYDVSCNDGIVLEYCYLF